MATLSPIIIIITIFIKNPSSSMISETEEWRKKWLKEYAGKNLDEHSQIETQSFITRDPYCDAKGRQDWWASIRRWGPSQGERSPKHNNNLDRNGPDAKSPLQSEKYWTFSSILSLLRSHLLVIHIPFWFELANNAFFMSLQRSGWLSKMDDILLGGHV